jgi:hypothetical protein
MDQTPRVDTQEDGTAFCKVDSAASPECSHSGRVFQDVTEAASHGSSSHKYSL